MAASTPLFNEDPLSKQGPVSVESRYPASHEFRPLWDINYSPTSLIFDFDGHSGVYVDFGNKYAEVDGFSFEFEEEEDSNMDLIFLNPEFALPWDKIKKQLSIYDYINVMSTCKRMYYYGKNDKAAPTCNVYIAMATFEDTNEDGAWTSFLEDRDPELSFGHFGENIQITCGLPSRSKYSHSIRPLSPKALASLIKSPIKVVVEDLNYEVGDEGRDNLLMTLKQLRVEKIRHIFIGNTNVALLNELIRTFAVESVTGLLPLALQFPYPMKNVKLELDFGHIGPGMQFLMDFLEAAHFYHLELRDAMSLSIIEALLKVWLRGQITEIKMKEKARFTEDDFLDKLERVVYDQKVALVSSQKDFILKRADGHAIKLAYNSESSDVTIEPLVE